jgi:prohibitin 1
LTSDLGYAADGQKSQTALREDAAKKAEKRLELRRRWQNRWLLMKHGVAVGVILLVTAILAFVLGPRIFIALDSGEVLVVYYLFFGGTNHNEIGHEGLHIIAPWDTGYRYQVRTQILLQPMTVLSKNGLEVHLDAQIRFHPIAETIPYLHRRYGPDYVKRIIVPGLIESVQEVIGQFLPEELYSFQRDASTGRILAKARRLIGSVFIEVEDIALFNVKLPPRLQAAIQSKHEEEQIALAYAFRVQKEESETQRKLIEAKGIQQYNEIVRQIPQSVLVWKGIEATLELAKSPNAKVIVIGSKDNLPLMLGNVPDLGGSR